MRIVLAIVVGVVLAAALMWALQRRLIYLPTQAVPPASRLLDGVEEVAIRTEDGLELAGWFVSASAERRDVAVLVLNGNGGNRALRAPLARALSSEGFDVLIFDYRGYGGNPGRPSEDGLHTDAIAAHDALVQRDDVQSDRVLVLGESLGAAVAVGLAQERPPMGLVLRSPFTSLADTAGHHYPFLPVGRLLWDRYPTEERVADVGVPLVVVAGDRDRIVPFDQSRRVYELAAEPKWFITVDDADHNDPALGHGDELVRAVVELAEVTGRG